MTELLESGEILFFYRPRVRAAGESPGREAAGPADVQRFFFVLRPRGRELYRRIVVGRKRLPYVTGERFWGAVEQVVSRPEELHGELLPERYWTRTRGERVQPAARPVGEGVYALVRHEKHTHLAYRLELPERLGAAQRELEILPRASYVLTVLLRPRGVAPPPGAPRNRFADATPELLDREGTELVLIGADEDVPAELGLELGAAHEGPEVEELLRGLALDPALHPAGPLRGGEWE